MNQPVGGRDLLQPLALPQVTSMPLCLALYLSVDANVPLKPSALYHFTIMFESLLRHSEQCIIIEGVKDRMELSRQYH